MPAKTQKKSSPVANSDEEEPSMLDLIKDMSSQLRGLTSKIDNIESEFKGLKVMLTDLKNENKQLKADARENERRIAELSDHNKNWRRGSTTSSNIIVGGAPGSSTYRCLRVRPTTTLFETLFTVSPSSRSSRGPSQRSFCMRYHLPSNS
jgi:hypothetical protein